MNRVKSIGVEILFTVSFMFFSFYSILPEDYKNVGIVGVTIVVAGICGFWFIHKQGKEVLEYANKHKTLAVFMIIYAVHYMFLLYQQKYVESAEHFFFTWPIFRLGCYMIGGFAVWFIGLSVVDKCICWIKHLFTQLTETDKKEYRLFSLILTAILIVFYVYTSGWYLQYDMVYSMDSGYCYNHIMASAAYYDIRHPFLSVITFPVFVFIKLIGNVIVPIHMIKPFDALAFGIINIQLLLLTGLQLKVLSGHRHMFRIYILSFSTLIYMFMFEKYPVCVFLLVLYVYSICKKERMRADTGLLLGAGAMPTSAVLGVVELFEHNTMKQKVCYIFKIILSFLAMLICFGRARVLWYGISELTTTKQRFGDITFPLQKRIYAVFDMIQGSFIAQGSELTDTYWWISIGEKIPIVGVVLLIVICLGIYEGWKEKYIKICTLWLVFAFVLFVALRWSPHESPLFSIYFSWALIPLALSGMDGLIEEFKWNEKYVYGGIVVIMAIINGMTILDINRFLKFFY